MKKIISLVVVATMLFTLFAVNVSAAVPTSYEDSVISENFDGTVAAGWTTVAGYNEANGTAAVNDGALTLTLTQKGDNTFMGPAMLVFSAATYYNNPPTADTVVEFDVTADDNKSALLLILRGSSSTMYELVMGAAGFVKGHTYRYIVKGMAQSGMASSGSGLSVYRRDITADGTWQLCTYKSGYNSSAGITADNGGFRSIMPDKGYAINDGRGALLSFGIGGYELFSTDGVSDPTGACYTIDNVSVYENKSYDDVDGVIFTDDFEGGTKYDAAHYGTAAFEPDTDGNTYVKSSAARIVYGDSDNGFNCAASEAIVEFDLWSKSGGSFSIQVRYNDGAYSYAFANVPTDGWYSYRITQGGNSVAGHLSGAHIQRAKKGSNEWTILTNGNGVTVGGPTSGLAFGGTNNIDLYPGADNEAWIDNIAIYEHEATSLVAAKDADETLNATFSFSDIVTLYNRPATMAAVLATFDGGVLVDVDFKTVTNVGGTINAALSADATDADEAYIYVWDGIGTAKPIMAEALDLTSYLQ